MDNENEIILVSMTCNVCELALDFTFETNVEAEPDESKLDLFISKLSDCMGINLELVKKKYIRNKLFRFKIRYMEKDISLKKFGNFLVLTQDYWNKIFINEE